MYLLFLKSARRGYLGGFLPRVALGGAIGYRGAVALVRWLQGNGRGWGFGLRTIVVLGGRWGSDRIWGVEQNSQPWAVLKHGYILHRLIVRNKTCAPFSVVPSCLVVNVRAETPNPKSSPSDPCSSTSDEWTECLLACTRDLILNSQDKHLLWHTVRLPNTAYPPNGTRHILD